MKKMSILIICCLLFVGCGKKDDTITKEQVEEIVDQAIQEHDEEVNDEQNAEDEGEQLMTSDGKFHVITSSDVDTSVIELVQNYTSYDVDEMDDDFYHYLHTLKCINTTNRNIDTISVFIIGDDIGTCSLHDVAPGDEMVFEYRFTGECTIDTICIDYISFEE